MTPVCVLQDNPEYLGEVLNLFKFVKIRTARIMDGSECGRDQPGFGEDSISQKLSPITLYIVVQFYQFSKETVYKTASCHQNS